MKCLVLSLSENSEKVSSIVSFIKKYDADCFVYELPIDCISDNMDDYDDLRLQNIITQLKETTHCIFLDFCAFKLSSTLMYIMGVISGKQIPVFISGKEVSLSKLLFGNNLIRLGPTSELVEVIEKYFVDYLYKEKKQTALYKIVERGFKFCPEDFIEVITLRDFETCQFFIEAGMDINRKTEKGITALSQAVRDKNTEAVKWLVNNGADINCIADDRGYSPIMDAVLKSNFLLTKVLVDHGAELNIIGKDGQSILGLAIGSENEEVTKILFENGADPDIKDLMNMSARDYAKLFNKKRLIELFDSKN